MKHPKTTILGILTILSALISAGTALLSGHALDYQAVVTAITAGIGLITAADGSKVGQ